MPLFNIYNGSNLETNKNERIKTVLSKTAHFEFEVKWVLGKENVIADALSRRLRFPVKPGTIDIFVED